jgi:hypothetical protein
VGINQPAPRRDDAGTHPVYQVDKGLSIISGEMLNRLYFIIVREDGRYQGDALVRGRGMADQSFPEWSAAVYERIISSTNA